MWIMLTRSGPHGIRRRRDAAIGTIELLERRTAVLEHKESLTDDDRQSALRMNGLLSSVTADFKSYHFTLIDSIENEDEAKAEQAILQEHELKIMDLVDRLGKLMAVPPKENPITELDLLSKRIDQVEKSYRVIKDAFDSHGPEMDIYTLQEKEESIEDSKSQLQEINKELLSVKDAETLEERGATLDRLFRTLKTDVKRLAGSKEEKPSVSAKETVEMHGIKLPRIETPTFDGNILNWRIFWEQFDSAIHSKSHLSDSDKLTYLREALKSGPAKNVVVGLTQTSENYNEAIRCLQKRYDRPRVLHQEHVRKIQEAYPLKTGSGQELRRLHDLLQQHIRALKASDEYNIGTYLTAAIELKLDESTKLRWTEHSSKYERTPPCEELLEFLDMQARYHESVAHSTRSVPKSAPKAAYTTRSESVCVICKKENHMLTTCSKFQNMSRDDRWAVIKRNGYCMNCLKPGHMANKCRVPAACRKCSKTHHTLLHIDGKPPEAPISETVSSATYVPQKKRGKQVLLMTCRAKITGPDGSIAQVRIFLDPGASCSFITERLVQQLNLPRRKDNSLIAGIAGVNTTRTRGKVSFTISRVNGKGRQVYVENAFILSKVCMDMPVSPVDSISQWKHLTGLDLADPEFGTPARVDILLGADYYGDILLRGRRWGPRGTPYAQRTCFGWVLAGPFQSKDARPIAYTCCIPIEDDSLRRFWEIEDYNMRQPVLSLEEKAVVEHFRSSYTRDETGRFIVSLPRKSGVVALGESRTQAEERFLRLERSLRKKGAFQEFAEVLREYFQMDHAELVPAEGLQNNQYAEVYYFPMHAVRKETSSTSKLRIVFDASAKTSTGTSLNDHLLVGPTVHAPLIDVLLRFRQHRVALTTDVSRMYRAVLLPEDQRDLHRFVWREDQSQPIKDYRMTRLTFGVSASSFAANMALKQNAIDHKKSHPQAYQVVLDSFYVDDGLTGADSVDEAVALRDELQRLFHLGGFDLRKWKASEQQVLASIPKDLIDPKRTQEIKIQNDYTKVLGVQWNAESDCFRPTISLPAEETPLTKRVLVSNIARLFDVMGWCSPSIILMKILLQRLWENHLSWDEPVPLSIEQSWERWRRELPELKDHFIARSYFPKTVKIVSIQLHGFCDASEVAYAGVVYLRAIDSRNQVHVSLVMAKTRVAPIKRLTIPRLELCSAVILSKLLSHVANTLAIPPTNIYAWSDSQVVLGWLQGNPRRFKPFVGNRIAEISETIPSGCWRHVQGIDNPADCASRGIFPSQLAHHEPWWYGPQWLKCNTEKWDIREGYPENPIPSEEREFPVIVLAAQRSCLSLIEKFSNYNRLRRVTTWIFRFLKNCRVKDDERTKCRILTVQEIQHAEDILCRAAQESAFHDEIVSLKTKDKLRSTSKLLTLHPFLDPQGLLRVGGRMRLADLPYKRRHPILLPGDHKLTKLIVKSEHERLMHAGSAVVSASLSRRIYILNGRRIIRTIVRSCIKCRKVAARPSPQLFGQLPTDRLNPGRAFDCVGIDYAGPLLIKSGPIRKPVLKKAYVAVFVCFATKAAHLELVSELTTEAFIATLRRFIGRRGLPSKIWSDHGTNFVGAEREIKELLRGERSTEGIAKFCVSQNIKWTFTPEHAPHFGGLWEAAVKAFKIHVRKVTGEVRLNFEEFTTILVQAEACLNSRPLTPLPDASEALEVLTPGHFLIGRPLTALPDEGDIDNIASLKRWQLCQRLVRHLWTRWSKEYLETLWKFHKWHTPSRDLQIGDIVCLRDEPLAPTKWPLARVVKTHPGNDGKVRVVTVSTTKGRYTRPITKVVPLVYHEDK